MSKKKCFRRLRICKAALHDVTTPKVADWIIARRASRRRRYSEKALPVVTVDGDAVNKDAFGVSRVRRTPIHLPGVFNTRICWLRNMSYLTQRRFTPVT